MADTGRWYLTSCLVEHGGDIPCRKDIEVVACCFTHETTKEEKVTVRGGCCRKRMAIAGKRGRRRGRRGGDTRFV